MKWNLKTCSFQDNWKHIFFDCIKNVSYTIFGALGVVGFCVFVLFSLPIYLFRGMVYILAPWLRADLGEMMNALSSTLANELVTQKTAPRCNIAVTVVFSGSIEENDAKQTLMKNWIRAIDAKTGKLKYAKFQQYPTTWMGFMFFKNCETFDINNHLHFHNNESGKEIRNAEDLEEFIEKLLNSPYPPNQSPWEIHVINNYYENEAVNPNEKRAVLVLKIHHCLADGFSILSALVEGLFEHPIKDSDLPKPRTLKRAGWDLWKHRLSLPFVVFQETCLLMSYKFRKTPWRVPDEKKAWHQVCVKSDLISIQKIKDIKNSFGVSFTSVLLSALAAATHKDLDQRKRNGIMKPEDDKGGMVCLSVLPLPGHNRRLTNHATAAIFDMPTKYFPSPVERLRLVNARMELTKNSVMPYFLRIFTTVVGWHFTFVYYEMAKHNFIPTGLTNFPSLPINVNWGKQEGKEVDFVAGALQGEAGLAISVLSYNQNIRIVTAAEKALMSKDELSRFVQDVTREINVLYELSKSRRKAYRQ